jgi:hypothetical protein
VSPGHRVGAPCCSLAAWSIFDGPMSGRQPITGAGWQAPVAGVSACLSGEFWARHGKQPPDSRGPQS